MTPTERTLRALRAEGRIVGKTEHWNSFAPRGDGGRGIRQDLFGFVDVIALCADRGIVGIQSTGTAFSAHLEKLLDSECSGNVIEWLRCGGRVELWGWRKLLVKRGGKAKRWVPRVREITLEDFPGA
jgi:hypothetical protein